MSNYYFSFYIVLIVQDVNVVRIRASTSKVFYSILRTFELEDLFFLVSYCLDFVEGLFGDGKESEVRGFLVKRILIGFIIDKFVVKAVFAYNLEIILI